MATKNHISGLAAAMLRPEFYPDRTASVELRETRISYVFLAGAYAYKVKKQLSSAFVDYSTLSKRRYFCAEEVRLYRRLAPQTYLGVAAISRADGAYFLGEGDSQAGRIVEYAVKMKRLPEDRMLSALLHRNAAKTDDMLKIAAKLVAFHRQVSSDKAPIYGSPQAIARNFEKNFHETRRFIGITISPAAFKTIQSYSEAFVREHRALLERRVAQGRVRDGHGDLRAEHVCLENGLEIYDCVEFNEALRYSDVVSEIACLSMDLDFAGTANLADEFAGAYAAAAGDDDLPDLLPFFKCSRAYLRGKVESLKSAASDAGEGERREAFLQALQYFLLALRYIKRVNRPQLLVVYGMAATGKSTVARLLSARTGFPVFDSDRVRKELAGITSAARSGGAWETEIDAPDSTRRTYQSLLAAANRQLVSGGGAILAATFAGDQFRRAALELAGRLRRPLLFVECRADEDIIKRRLEQRARDRGETSDAIWTIYRRMRDQFHPFSDLPDGRHCVLDTERRLLSDLTAVEEKL